MALSSFPSDYIVPTPNVYFEDHFYPSGGSDQIAVSALSSESANILLDDHFFLLAAKSFNLRCMRKGAQPYANFHCFPLADLVMP